MTVHTTLRTTDIRVVKWRGRVLAQYEAADDPDAWVQHWVECSHEHNTRASADLCSASLARQIERNPAKYGIPVTPVADCGMVKA